MRLQEIRLEHKGIVGIVKQDLEFFPGLRSLRLDNNHLTDFSDLGLLPNLCRLHLSCNRIHTLPTLTTGLFYELRVLDISFNFIKATDILGAEAEWARLPSLQELDLSGNDFRKAPEAIGSFPSLRKLSLEYNQLTSECLKPLSALPVLQHLGCAHNKISRLPERLAEDPEAFRSLQVLDVSCNSIRCPSSPIMRLHGISFTLQIKSATWMSPRTHAKNELAEININFVFLFLSSPVTKGTRPQKAIRALDLAIFLTALPKSDPSKNGCHFPNVGIKG
jgi:Leucine-rich repeat (LRR) protein